jgi:hypothetical protein
MEILITLIGGIGLAMLLILYSALSWGYVTYVLYNWFVLTNITELPHFTITQFIGFALFLRALMPHSSEYIKDEYKDKTTMYAMSFLGPWIVLLFSWVLKLILF